MGSSGHTAQDSSGQLKTAHKLLAKMLPDVTAGICVDNISKSACTDASTACFAAAMMASCRCADASR